MKFIFINIYLIKAIFLFTSTAFSSNFPLWIKELETEALNYGISKQTYSNTMSELTKVNKKVLIDTNIPLLGDNNAFKVFGPQKGLANSEIKFLEKNVERILNLLSNEMDSSLDPFKEGTGASGGLSFALGEVLGCEIISGPQFFLNETKLIGKINDFEIAILCEGKFDFSSMSGKVLGEILKLHTGQTYFLGGKFDYNDESIFTDIFELGNKGMKNSKKALRDSAYTLAKKIGK